MEMTKNKRSQGRGTKSLSKSLFNSIVLGKEIIMKKLREARVGGRNHFRNPCLIQSYWERKLS